MRYNKTITLDIHIGDRGEYWAKKLEVSFSRWVEHLVEREVGQLDAQEGQIADGSDPEKVELWGKNSIGGFEKLRHYHKDAYRRLHDGTFELIASDDPLVRKRAGF